jgi:hypothetical protein
LSDTQFSTLKSAGPKDLEGPEKYNNNEVKYGETFQFSIFLLWNLFSNLPVINNEGKIVKYYSY